MVEVRRSRRVANLPATVYKEIVSYASDKARASATLKAEEVESSLGADNPTFVKPMLQSHVTGCWLGLSVYWCRRRHPKPDDTVTLIDEEGEEYRTVVRKSGFGAGWRGFSIAHGLVDGDALVFQLIPPTAFKVKDVDAQFWACNGAYSGSIF